MSHVILLRSLLAQADEVPQSDAAEEHVAGPVMAVLDPDSGRTCDPMLAGVRWARGLFPAKHYTPPPIEHYVFHGGLRIFPPAQLLATRTNLGRYLNNPPHPLGFQGLSKGSTECSGKGVGDDYASCT